MIRKWLRKVLYRPVLWASHRFASKPDRVRIFEALSDLLNAIITGDEKKGPVLSFDCTRDKFILFSDHHKGTRNGADDFVLSEPNYLAALDHYFDQGYYYVALGDCEELWENLWLSVKKQQAPAFEREKRFAQAGRMAKVYGNHDLFWQNDPFAPLQIKEVYGCDLPIYEGVLLQTSINGRSVNILCTHGHQGDAISDGNWFSKFFISKIWAPLQSFLHINPNTPAYDAALKTAHNTMMQEWSATQDNLFLITGHTHQPVFESLTHIERLYRSLLFAQQVKDHEMIGKLQADIRFRKFEYDRISPDYLKLKPSYFNTGCCCYNDGDITGIEIEQDCIRLIKWKNSGGSPSRLVLEEAPLEELLGSGK